MSIDWVQSAAILTAVGVITTGVFAAIVQGWFRKPEQAATVTQTYNGSYIDLVKQNDLILQRNQELRDSNAKLDRNLTKMSYELRITRDELRTTREVMALFLDVVERATPALQKAAPDTMPELAHAMKLARTKANSNGGPK